MLERGSVQPEEKVQEVGVLFALAAARCGRLGRVLVGLSSVVPVLLLVDGVVRAV